MIENDRLEEILHIPLSELQQRSKVRLEIVPDLDTLHLHFARAIAEEIKTNNAQHKPTRLILPVGPVGQYPILVNLCNEERISWQNVHTFNMDEYLDWQGRALPLDHPMSFEGFMRREVFQKLDTPLQPSAEQTHFPDPRNVDRISTDIQNAGGIDTCYGGVGYHGHIAFNEPPISRWFKVSVEEFKESVTRLVALEPETIVMNSIRASGGNPAGIPPMAITLGMKDILSAKRLRLYCQGGLWQRTILRLALLGEPDVDYPVTLAQGHADYTIITDTHTAQPVTNRIAA